MIENNLRISKKADKLKRNISPVREIMSYASPEILSKYNIDKNDFVSFAGGWVNHEAPVELKKAYENIVCENNEFHKSGAYSPTLGMTETKTAIIQFESILYEMNGLHEDNIAVGHSSTQIANDLFQVLLNPDDSILLLDPSYCNYPTQIFTGFNEINLLRFNVLDNSEWKYNAESKIHDFVKYIKDNKPKVVLLIVPDNPTSQILSDNFVKKTLEAVKEIDGFLVIDFAYKEIVFGDSVPDYFSWTPNQNFLSIHSNSKWGRGLGRRMGWIEAPAFVIEAMESIWNSTILCPDTLHQMAFVEYLDIAGREKIKNYVEETRNQYAEIASHIISVIDKYIGYPCLMPEGGLYTVMKVNENSALFVERILKNTGVLMVPGWGFGRSLNEAVRISYGPLVGKPDIIEKAIKKLGTYLHSK